MAVEVASLFATLNLKDNMTDGLKNAKGGLTGFSDQMKNAGTAVSGLGKSMLAGTAPMIAALGIAVTSAMGFNESLTNIQAVTGQSAQEIDALGETILDMDTRFSSVELANTFYDIAGGVTDASARMDVFNTAVHVAQAGNAELQGTTAALIGTMNAYAGSNLTAATAGDILVRTVGMGVGTMDQFAAALPKVTGMAASVGVSFEEISAATAFLTTKGNTASEATTQLAAAMNSLLNPNNAMTEAFKLAGIESGSLSLSQDGLIGTLNILKDAFGGNIDAMAEAFGGTEALRAAISLTGGDVDAFFASFTEGVDGATAAAEDIQMESAAAQFDVLKSSLQDVGIEIGNELLPALIDLGNEAKPVIRSFGDFIRQNPQTVRTVAMVAGGIAVLGAVLVPVGMAITAFGTVLGVVGTVLGLLVSPVALAVAAVVGLGAAIYFLSGGSLGELSAALQTAVGWVKTFAGGLIEAFQSGGLQGAATFIQDNLVTPIRDFLATTDWSAVGTALWERVKTAVKTAAANIDWGQVADAAWSALMAYWQFQANLVWNAPGWIFKNITMPLFQAAQNLDWSAIGNAVWDGLKSAFDTMVGWQDGARQWILDKIVNPIKDALGIASPSTVFFQIGNDIVQGLINALLAGSLALMGQITAIGLGIVTALTTAIGDMAAWVTNNIVSPMVNTLSNAVGLFSAAATSIANAVIGPFQGIINMAGRVMSAISGANSAGASVTTSNPNATVTTDSNGNTTLTLPATYRAGGGAVYGGSAYIVGERGPELFMPGQSGRVIPNSQLSGGGGGGINFYAPVYFNGVQNPQQMYDAIMKEKGRRAPTMAGGINR